MLSRRLLRRRQKSLATAPRITLTPLIDTALVLLVIFMVTAPLVQRSIKIELPTGQAKEHKHQQEEIELYIDGAGELYFDGKKVSLHECLTILTKKFAQREEKTLIVKSDRTVPYGIVIETIDAIKHEGIVTDVVLATEHRTKKTRS